MNTSDIYADLNSVDLGEKIIQLQELLKLKEIRILKYEDDVEKLCLELTRMKRRECSLEKNISELFNSSKLEIERKDIRIAELQTTIDNLIINQRCGYYDNTPKHFWEETRQESSSKSVEINNYSTTQHANIKSHSRSSKSLSCNMQHAQLKLEDDLKPENKSSKSRSKSPRRRSYSKPRLQTMAENSFVTQKHNHRSRSESPRYHSRSRHPLQSTVETGFIAQNRCSRSRSKSPRHSEPHPLPNFEGSSRMHLYKSSKSRSISPRHRSRSKHRLRSTVENDLITQKQYSKSRSKSPIHLEPHPLPNYESSSKIHLYESNKSHSKSHKHRSRSRHRLQLTVDNDFITQTHSSRSRSKSPMHLEPHPLQNYEGSSKIHPYKSSKSRSKSPKHHSHSRHHLRSTVDNDLFIQKRSSRSRSKSSRHSELHSLSNSEGSSKMYLYKSSKSRSKSPRYNPSIRERRLSPYFKESSRSRSRKYRCRNKRLRSPRSMNHFKVCSKGTGRLLKSPRRYGFNRQSGIKCISKRHTISKILVRPSRRTDHERSRYNLDQPHRSSDYRRPDKCVAKMKNAFQSTHRRPNITIEKSHENCIGESKDSLEDYANGKPLKRKCKSLEGDHKTDDVKPHRQNSSNISEGENKSESHNTNSKKIDDGEKVLLNNYKTESVILDKSVVNKNHSNEIMDMEQIKSTTDIKFPISTCESLPTSSLSNNLAAEPHNDEGMKKTVISVRKKRRCVIQLIE